MLLLDELRLVAPYESEAIVMTRLAMATTTGVFIAVLLHASREPLGAERRQDRARRAADALGRDQPPEQRAERDPAVSGQHPRVGETGHAASDGHAVGR